MESSKAIFSSWTFWSAIPRSAIISSSPVKAETRSSRIFVIVSKISLSIFSKSFVDSANSSTAFVVWLVALAPPPPPPLLPPPPPALCVAFNVF